MTNTMFTFLSITPILFNRLYMNPDMRIRSEFIFIEIFRSPADFFVRREKDSDRAVLDFWVIMEVSEDAHDDSEPGFIVAP